MSIPVKRLIGTLLLSSVVITLLLTPETVRAQAAGGIKMTAQAGFNGYCRSGEWIPVRITLDNSGAAMDGQVEVSQNPAGSNAKIYAGGVDLPSPAHKILTVMVYPEGYLDSLSVRLATGSGQTLATASAKVVCLGSDDYLFGILSDSANTFNVLANLKPDNGRTYLAPVTGGDLPGQAEGLKPLDLLVISDVDSGSLTPDQQNALAIWVMEGGRLLVTGGLDWRRTTSGVVNLLPDQPGVTQALNNLNSLAAFSGRQETLAGTTNVTQAGLIKAGAETLLSQDGTALILKKASGLGQVYYLAFDPALAPFSGWTGSEDFYRYLLDLDTSRPAWGWGFQNWDSASLAIQTLPGTSDSGAPYIFAFIFLYILVIGPLNYWALKRFVRSGLAWITTPALALLFCLAAILYGAFGNSRQPFANRLAVVQTFPDEQQAVVDGLVGIHSPVSGSYSLEAGNGLLMRPLPRNSASGSLIPAHAWTFKNLPGGGGTVEAIPVDATGFEGVAVQGQVPAADIHGELTLQINGSGKLLAGTLTNNSEITLNDSVLLTPWGPQKLDVLAAHSSRNIAVPVNTAGLAATQKGLSRGEGEATLGLFAPGDNPFIKDLLGSSNAASDPLTQQKMALLSAFQNGTGRQGNVYLAGWSTSSPLDIKLSGQTTAGGPASTLYLVSINTQISLAGGPITLDPALYNWQVIQNSGMIQPAPYQAYLGQGSVTMDYQPVGKIGFKAVQSLTLHLEGNDNNGAVPFALSLWDWQAHSWSVVKNITWGDLDVATPGSLVSPDGEVRIQIATQRTDAPYLKRADFTLVVNP